MNDSKELLFEQYARIGKALANPKRLELLELLCQGEKTVETLSLQMQEGLKNVSAQLKVLKTTRLITSRREGKYVYYKLADESVTRFWRELQILAKDRLAEVQTLIHMYFSNRNELIQIEWETLVSKAQNGEIILLDVRPKDEYEAAHLPNARSIPLSELKTEKIKLSKDKKIVAYCRGSYCVMSIEAVNLLKSKGYDASCVELGISEWRALGVPLEQGITQ